MSDSSSARNKSSTASFLGSLAKNEEKKIFHEYIDEDAPHKMMDKRSYRSWKKGGSVIRLEYAFNICYLIGRSMQEMLLGEKYLEFNKDAYIAGSDYNRHIKEVVRYINEAYYSKSIQAMAGDLEVSSTCLNNWLKAADCISTENLCKLAKTLDVPIDYLFYKDFKKYLRPPSKNGNIVHFPELLHFSANTGRGRIAGSIATKKDCPKLTCSYQSPITGQMLFISSEGEYSRDKDTNNFLLTFKSRKNCESLILKFEIFGNYKNRYNLIGGIGQLQIDTYKDPESKDPKSVRETQVFVYSILQNELQRVFKHLDEDGSKLSFGSDTDKLVYRRISREAAESIKDVFGTDICPEAIVNISEYLHIPPDRCEKLIRKYLKVS